MEVLSYRKLFLITAPSSPRSFHPGFWVGFGVFFSLFFSPSMKDVLYLIFFRTVILVEKLIVLWEFVACEIHNLVLLDGSGTSVIAQSAISISNT